MLYTNGEGGGKGTSFPCHILLISTQTSEGLVVVTSPPRKASEVTAAGGSDAA